MLSHQNIQIGKILKSWGKLTTHVDDKGLYLVCKIREDIEVANELWEQILKGKVNGFSIGCELLTDPRTVCDSNGCVDVIDKINILEVSVCNFPVNKLSGFTIISKSDSNSKDVCKSCNIFNQVDKMVEETKIETKEEPKVEVKDETKELSVEERLEVMERSIFNIQAAITKMSEVQMSEEVKAKKPEEKKPEEEKPIPPEEKKPEVPCKSEVVPVKTEEVLTKKDFDEFKKSMEDLVSKSIASIAESLKPKEQDIKAKSEMELALKARDDQIESLKKHIETFTAKEHIDTITKAEANAEPKTVQDNKEKELILEEDYPIKISKGEVSFRKFV
jgi:HK97 family phage prohead protease